MDAPSPIPIFGLCVVSAAVAVAAGAQLETGLELALCVVFHAGIVLLVNGVRAGERRLRRA
jgi:uncharacterized membrane protein